MSSIKEFIQHVTDSRDKPRDIALEVAKFATDWLSKHMLGSSDHEKLLKDVK